MTGGHSLQIFAFHCLSLHTQPDPHPNRSDLSHKKQGELIGILWKPLARQPSGEFLPFDVLIGLTEES